MKQTVGTISTQEDEILKSVKLTTKFTGGSNPGNNNGDNGGGGNGGDRRDNDNYMEEEKFIPNKYRLGMWIALLAIVMTFAGLIGAYIVVAVNKQLEWRPFDLPYQVWFSTIVIIASSFTFELAKRAINDEKQDLFRRWLITTTVLGAVFISSQLLAWFALVQRGVYLSSNPYAGFFYILTAIHAVHLLGGILALGYLFLITKKNTYSPDLLYQRQVYTGVIGLYWHTMDGLWLVLFTLLAFWK